MKRIEEAFHPFPILETDRTRLRPISHDDVEDMYRYCSNPDVARYTTWEAHRSPEDTRQFIDFIVSRYEPGQVGVWGIEDRASGRLIGTCDFVSWSSAHARAEVGYALSAEFWNRGIMTEVVGRVLEFGFHELDLERIEAKCLMENPGSAKVMEKAGMRFEGILRKYANIKGEFKDLKLYSILREEFEA